MLKLKNAKLKISSRLRNFKNTVQLSVFFEKGATFETRNHIERHLYHLCSRCRSMRFPYNTKKYNSQNIDFQCIKISKLY